EVLPEFEPKTAYAPPTRWYPRGLTRSIPVFQPVWCSSSMSAPSNMPPSLPSLARNSSMIRAFQSLSSDIVRILLSDDAASQAYPPHSMQEYHPPPSSRTKVVRCPHRTHVRI